MLRQRESYPGRGMRALRFLVLFCGMEVRLLQL